MLHKPSINLCMLLLATLAYSCTPNATQVESSKAQTVAFQKTVSSSIYEKIKPGSAINWRATHVGGIEPREGKIYCKKASVLVDQGKVINARVSVDMNNMTVDNLPADAAKNLVEHLKSEDFFDIKNHSTSSFESTKLESINGEYNTKITGNLSILGISKSITFNANISVSEKEVSIASENFAINRADWGMTYNAEGTAGVPLDYLIADKVGFQIALVIASH